jgi:chemotaxis signal transduction protein
MIETAPIMSDRALELRREFDRSFAEPAQTSVAETADFIAVRLGENTYALRMAEIGGLYADLAITPCPSPLPELLGLAGLRSALTPVYDLAALLGHSASAGRWLVLAKGGQAAFAFDAFEDHFRVGLEAVALQQEMDTQRYVTAAVRHREQALPVIDLPSLVAAIRRRLPNSHSKD